MRPYTVLAALMMLAATGYTQDDKPAYSAIPDGSTAAHAAKAEQNYAACLATANDGVTESALAHVALMKLSMPERDYRLLNARVADVARTAGSPEIRYKAFLTGMVLGHPEVFTALPSVTYQSPDEFFGAVASRLGEYYATR